MQKFMMVFVAAVTTTFVMACTPLGYAQATEPSTGRSSAQIVDFILNIQEHRILEMAEIMPAGKYSFVPGGDGFQGVRTFAEQLRHIAADNYLLAAGMLGEKPPVDVGRGEDGSDAVRTKSEIIDYVKSSFRYMHRAVSTIDDENIPIPRAADFALAGGHCHSTRPGSRRLCSHLGSLRSTGGVFADESHHPTRKPQVAVALCGADTPVRAILSH